MNWGNKLVLVFIAFAGLMFVLVYNAMHTRYELVSKDYYQDELRYQEKIDGKYNASTVSDISFQIDQQYLILQMPKEFIGKALKGDVWLYCKTDAIKDLRLPLTANSDGMQFIPKNKLKASKYILKLSWEFAEKKYYTEQYIELHMQ
ncbi:MAG: FixH family protein [Chitinophagaceae bacterium]|nr:FixH family protein [Chitinophagaceae bacterium]